MDENDPNPVPDQDGLDQFVDRIRLGDLSAGEFAAVEARLSADPAFRRRYRERIRLESNLLVAFRASGPDIVPPMMVPVPKQRMRWPWIAALAGATAASLLIGFFAGSRADPVAKAPVMACLESSSDATWGENSPGGIGSPIVARELDLRSGLAEIRFTSGAIVALEAPARLDVIDPMRCRLYRGLAIVNVPDAAKGFTVETPDGHAIDHGTRFVVQTDEARNGVDFEVLEGMISVHHRASGAVVPLEDAEAARLTNRGIESLAEFPSRRLGSPPKPSVRRVRTHGRETSIVRIDTDEARKKLLDSDLLMVKKDLTRTIFTESHVAHYARDRRSLIGFPLDGVDPSHITGARMVLNLVPTGLGFASSLPATCAFEVYGIRDDPSLEAWPTEDLRWKDAPGSIDDSGDVNEAEVHHLGTIKIPRGKVSGALELTTPELLAFLQADTTGEVSFLLVQSTPPLDSYSVVHAFAASTHPTGAGPTLELNMSSPDGQ